MKLEEEKFKLVKELSDISMEIADKRTALSKLIEEEKQYISDRERSVDEMVKKKLADSEAALKKAEKNFGDASAFERDRKKVLELANAAKEKYETALKDIELRETALICREEMQRTREEDSLRESEELLALRKQCTERDVGLSTREANVKLEEERQSESSQQLSLKWTQFHNTTTEKEKEILMRRERLTKAEKDNEMLSESLKEKERALNTKEREISTRYESLEKSSDEIARLQRSKMTINSL